MNGFDKFCAALGFLLGTLLLLMGVFGLFTGVSANFSHPPILGMFPAFVGWGIVRSIQIAWNCPRTVDTPKNDQQRDDDSRDVREGSGVHV